MGRRGDRRSEEPRGARRLRHRTKLDNEGLPFMGIVHGRIAGFR
jgi:hypothetical protein